MNQNLNEMIEEHRAGSPWKKGMVIFVDVDDTLIDRHDAPKDHVVRFVVEAARKGCVLYLWSQGGADYAAETAIRLGLANCFEGYLPKPDIAVDDLPFTTPYTKHFHPIQLI